MSKRFIEDRAAQLIRNVSYSNADIRTMLEMIEGLAQEVRMLRDEQRQGWSPLLTEEKTNDPT